MSVDVRNNAGEEFSITNSGWRYLMTFAELHGFVWPTDAEDNQAGELNDVQAKNLADAIYRGIGALPVAEAARLASEVLTRELMVPSQSPMFPAHPIQLNPETINYWKLFSAFACKGGFSIEF